jgi:hypothetical protein
MIVFTSKHASQTTVKGDHLVDFLEVTRISQLYSDLICSVLSIKIVLVPLYFISIVLNIEKGTCFFYDRSLDTVISFALFDDGAFWSYLSLSNMPWQYSV